MRLIRKLGQAHHMWGKVMALTIHDQRKDAEVEPDEMALLIPWS
jgi:hypothetical protein